MAQIGKKKSKKRKILATALLCTGLLAIASDYRLCIRDYTLSSHKIKNPLRLLLITDLHSCSYGVRQKNLLGMIDTIAPDVILLGGDILDDKLPYAKGIELLQSIGENYPCYYVSGNHEFRTGDIENIKALVEGCGVTVLNGDCDFIRIDQTSLAIMGVDDPSAIGKNAMLAQLDAAQAQAKAKPSDFTVLLAHRPDLIEDYLPYGPDLVLSGHTHGGQWRLPGLINGLLAPHQGLFPALAGGVYGFGKTALVVSRGLSRESTLVPRFFNPPELVSIDLLPPDDDDFDDPDYIYEGDDEITAAYEVAFDDEYDEDHDLECTDGDYTGGEADEDDKI